MPKEAVVSVDVNLLYHELQMNRDEILALMLPSQLRENPECTFKERFQDFPGVEGDDCMERI